MILTKGNLQMNVIILVGRLTRDPNVRYLSETQQAVAKFSIAIDRGKDRSGKDLGADFPKIICFGKQAELVEKYLGKGMQVGIQGRLQTRSIENRDGKKIYITEVAADRVEFLNSRTKKDYQIAAFVRDAVKTLETPEWGSDVTFDEIPF